MWDLPPSVDMWDRFPLHKGGINFFVYEGAIKIPFYTCGTYSPCIDVLSTSLCIRVLPVSALSVANWFPPISPTSLLPVYTRYRPAPLKTRPQRSPSRRGGSVSPLYARYQSPRIHPLLLFSVGTRYRFPSCIRAGLASFLYTRSQFPLV